MKINVSIEINDADRVGLADPIDGKVTKRKVTRREIVALCRQHIGGLLGRAYPIRPDEPGEVAANPFIKSLYTIDPEDRAILAGKTQAYVRGWNMVKHGASRA